MKIAGGFKISIHQWKSKKKHYAKILFLVYLLFLCDLVIFKFFGNFNRVVEMRNEILFDRMEGCPNYNFIPLRSVMPALRSAVPLLKLSIAGNIFLFLPLGFFVSYFSVPVSFFKTVSVCLAIIVGFEAIQYVTCLGIFDVDDIILNIIGSVAGWFVFIGINKWKICRQIYKT